MCEIEHFKTWEEFQVSFLNKYGKEPKSDQTRIKTVEEGILITLLYFPFTNTPVKDSYLLFSKFMS